MDKPTHGFEISSMSDDEYKSLIFRWLGIVLLVGTAILLWCVLPFVLVAPVVWWFVG